MHRSCVIPLVIWLSLGSCPSSALAQIDEHAGSTNPETDGFASLVRQGARAADQGQLSTAIDAYEKALKIYHDPLIAGRLGLLYSMTGIPSDLPYAAHYLYGAVMSSAGKSATERKAFFEAWDFAQTKVCRLIVVSNSETASIAIGSNISAHTGSAWIYAKPGKHTVVGQLDGHTQERTIDCPHGKETFVNFIFAPTIDIRKLLDQAEERLAFLDTGSLTLRAPDKPTTNPLGKTLRGVGLKVGPIAIFGVTRTPAYGLSASASYKLKHVNPTLATRAAYAPRPYEGNALDIYNFSALVGACKPIQWIDLCGFGGFNIIKPVSTVATPESFYTYAQYVPGFSIGVRTKRNVSKTISLYASGDATVLTEPAALVWNGRTLDGGRFLASISAGVEFGE